MTLGLTPTRVLLLVEDNPGDADFVSELLAEADRDNYSIIHVRRLSEAVGTLATVPVDVIVLDLGLPDCSGVESVRAIREAGAHAPIVVLTGSDDEKLALSCIDAGAQDYLAKREVGAHNLRRAIGYSITRIREAQLRGLEDTLEKYRAMSSATQATSVTAALAGSGAIAARNPSAFAALVDAYFALFVPYLDRVTERVEPTRLAMERIVTDIGDLTGGPRDLLDVHVAALDRAIAQSDTPHSWSIVMEARLFALRMMGLLVDYYRVGQRRRHLRGGNP
jgi:CheY-like chemotaxis protein